MSFRIKTITGLILIQSFFLTLLFFVSMSVLQKSTETAVNKRAITTANLFAVLAKDSVLSYDLATLDSYVTALLKQPELIYVRIIDRQDNILVGEGDKNTLARPFIQDNTIEQIDDGIFDTFSSITEGGKSFGRVEIGLDINFVSNIENSAQKQLASLSILVVFLTAIFSFFFGQYLTRQLSALVQASQFFSDGELDHRVKVYSNDELGQTAKAFNKMADKLKSLYQDLHQYRENLEVKVKKRTKELEQARDAAEAGTKTKAAFIANMSHEIRTPMNAVIGFAEVTLQDKDLSPQTTKHVATILSSARSLLGIINDILDVSKLESGKFSLENICFHLPNTLADVLQTVEHQAAEKNLILKLEYDSKLPLRFMGDPTRLRQVILNLVGNSIKFTPKGHVIVYVQPGESPSMLNFTVSDTGIGMTREQSASVFDSFAQCDDSMTRRFGGTGLGTTISKQIVELMQGKIWLESEWGKGSSFHFNVCMPEAPDTEECLNEQKSSTLTEYFSPRLFNILLAEDLEVNATLAILRLEQQGHTIHWVKNGLEAVIESQDKHYDIILMDIMMPELDGLGATREIRQLEQKTGYYMPILALTASVMREDHDNCRAAGMDAIEAKPIDFNKLFKTIENLVPNGKGKVNDKHSVKIGAQSELDFSPLDGIVDYKEAIKTWKIAGVYLKALISFATDRANDAKTIKKLLAQHTDDSKPARSVAHALKGVAGNLSIKPIARLATEIDSELKSGHRINLEPKLQELQQSLDITITAILNLNQTQQQVSKPKYSFDKILVQELMQKLMESLDELNPDIIEPIMDKLTDYVAETDLIDIQTYLDAFNFDEAKCKTKNLAKQLDISLE